jgi:hypothetical protein
VTVQLDDDLPKEEAAMSKSNPKAAVLGGSDPTAQVASARPCDLLWLRRPLRNFAIRFGA